MAKIISKFIIKANKENKKKSKQREIIYITWLNQFVYEVEFKKCMLHILLKYLCS